MHKMTSKRQVTVPKPVCDALGLFPGDYVEVFERDGVAHMVKMSDQGLGGAFARMAEGRTWPSSAELKQARRARAGRKLQNL